MWLYRFGIGRLALGRRLALQEIFKPGLNVLRSFLFTELERVVYGLQETVGVSVLA